MDVKDLNWLLNSGGERRRAEAQVRRGGSYPDWVEDFLVLAIGGAGDPTMDESTGIRHTVQSMVSELRARVALDAITKEASAHLVTALSKLGSKELSGVEKRALLSALGLPRLSYKQAGDVDGEKILASMEDYILRHHVRPSRGHTPAEALYESVKDQFGIEGVTAAGGREVIIKMLRRLREENEAPNAADALPTYDGTPSPLKYDYDPKDRSLFMSRDTSGSPGSYM